ncbi:MAG: hypothetical protein FGM37_04875 [Phycisphaerales bacterium]|nr:hypothetical protein [Phycisphaerales bacterium]
MNLISSPTASRMALALASCAALTAWTATSSAPTLLFGGANDQVQPKTHPLASGGIVMSCFDNATGGYDVRVNRFDDRGAPMWGASGVLVADRSVSSTTDYGSAAAPDGGIVVAYQPTTGANMAVSRVSGSGALLWSTTLTTTTDFIANGKVVFDSAGDLYVGWLQGTSTRVQKVSYSDGTAVWATPVTLSETSVQQQMSDMVPALDGAGVVVSTVRQTGFTSPKLLRAWRVGSDGTIAWGPKNVFASGSLQTGNYPTFSAMPGVGYVFGFYTNSPLQSWVQVLDTSGNPLAAFGTNGLAVTSTTTGYNRTNPAVAVDPSGIVFVNWYQQVPNTSIYGCRAQAFSVSGGQRLWGDAGLALSPDATAYSITQPTAAFRPGFGVAFGWVNSSAFGSDTLLARAVDGKGTDLWTAGTVTVSSASSKSRAQGVAACGGLVWVWQDGGTGSSDIVGARVGTDGSLGDPPAGPTGDINGDGSVNGLDLTALLAAWGSAGGPADLNGDSTVNGLDLTVLLAAWTG